MGHCRAVEGCADTGESPSSSDVLMDTGDPGESSSSEVGMVPVDLVGEMGRLALEMGEYSMYILFLGVPSGVTTRGCTPQSSSPLLLLSSSRPWLASWIPE